MISSARCDGFAIQHFFFSRFVINKNQQQSKIPPQTKYRPDPTSIHTNTPHTHKSIKAQFGHGPPKKIAILQS